MNSKTLERYYTNIAANLLLSSRRDRLKTLLVTSAVDGEGKTTTAYNVARTVAHSGKKTLLMDAHVRNPSLEEILGVQTTQGLGEFLAGRTPLDQTVLEDRDISHLSYIPFGQADERKATFLLQERFGSLLDELAPSYEFIFIDGDSVLSNMTPLILASRVDGVLLVVRCDQTQKDQVVQARSRILAHGGTILGVTLNRVPAYVPAGMRI